jgi:hypothetical protein
MNRGRFTPIYPYSYLILIRAPESCFSSSYFFQCILAVIITFLNINIRNFIIGYSIRRDRFWPDNMFRMFSFLFKFGSSEYILYSICFAKPIAFDATPVPVRTLFPFRLSWKIEKHTLRLRPSPCSNNIFFKNHCFHLFLIFVSIDLLMTQHVIARRARNQYPESFAVLNNFFRWFG